MVWGDIDRVYGITAFNENAVAKDTIGLFLVALLASDLTLSP